MFKRLKNKKAIGFVDSGVKILIAVVIGALLLGGIYTLTKDTVMPNVKTKVESLFDYSGSSGGSNGGSLEEKYEFIECSDLFHNAGGGLEYTGYKVNASVNDFVSLKLDEVEIESSQYTITGTDTTSIEFKRNPLEGLESGNHTISAMYKDGYAVGSFYVTVEKDFSINGNDHSFIVGETFGDWLARTEKNPGTNNWVWRKDNDKKVYVDSSYREYLYGVTWDTVIVAYATYCID